MAIAVDNAGVNLSAGYSAGTLTTPNFTMGSVSNGLLVVTAHIDKAGGIGTTAITGMTFNGVALTNAVHVTAAGNTRTEIWYLIGPSSGAFPVVVSYSGAPSAMAVTGCSFSGVAASPSIGTSSAGTASSTSATFTCGASAANANSWSLFAWTVPYTSSLEGPPSFNSFPGRTTATIAVGLMLGSGGAGISGLDFRSEQGFFASGAATLTLNSNDGSGYEYTAASMTFDPNVATNVPVTQGTYIVSGKPVSFASGLAVAQGAYAVSGNPISLQSTQGVSQGHYAVNGNPVSFVALGPSPPSIIIGFPSAPLSPLFRRRRRLGGF